MTIRKATSNETAKILEHSLVVLKEASMGYVTPKKAKAIQHTESFISNGGYYLVCSEEEVIKGWIGLSNGMDYNTDEPIGFISELFIIPTWRKQGIAEKLLREALVQFEKLGYERVQLNIYAGNKAKTLYEKIGFHDISTIMEKNINETQANWTK
ncbi:GNAT family N-acetyltransferase [Virgibacillus oceani]